MSSRGVVATMVASFFVKMTARVRWIILAYIVTRLFAAVIYQPIEGWQLMDGWWWGEVASLTIGYGDLAPKTAVGRLLATPFHFFWVYYINLALGAHLITYLIRNAHVLTHYEQEWLFRVVGVMFDWMRWSVVTLDDIARALTLSNRSAGPIPHTDEYGALISCPEQAPDTEEPSLTVGGN